MSDLFLDNLSEEMNMVLNVLWDVDRSISISELTDAINEKYHKNWNKTMVREVADVLVYKDYAQKERHLWNVSYRALSEDSI